MILDLTRHHHRTKIPLELLLRLTPNLQALKTTMEEQIIQHQLEAIPQGIAHLRIIWLEIHQGTKCLCFKRKKFKASSTLKFLAQKTSLKNPLNSKLSSFQTLLNILSQRLPLISTSPPQKLRKNQISLFHYLV